MGEVITDKKKQLLLLIVISIGMFMDSLDGSIVNIALPTMSIAFGIDTSTASWIVTIYFLTVASLILVFGKLANNNHVKKIFVAGFTFFTIGSLLCAISPTMPVLLASRVIQATGASMIASSTMLLCVKYLPPHMLGFGLSITVLGASIGVAAGPFVGGILTHLVSWHWIFLINIPIGLITTFIALRVIPSDLPPKKKFFDLTGAIILFVMLVSGLYILETVPSNGFDTTSATLLALFILSLIAFIKHVKSTDDPVLDVNLLNSRGMLMAMISFLLLNACYIGIQYLLPFYMEKGLNFDTMMSGLYLVIPAAITLFVCSYIGKLCDKMGRRIFTIIANSAIIASTTILALITPDMGVAPLIFSLICLGIVFGVGGGPGGSRIVDNAPEDKKGEGSAILSFIIYFGSALGSTVFSSMFRIGSGSSEEFTIMQMNYFMNGFHFAMIIGIVLGAIALICAFTKERKVMF